MAPDIGMTLVVRSGNAALLAQKVRAAVRDVNANLAIFNVKTMEQVVADSMWELRLFLWLIGLFALLALVLAAVGLFGVLSYSVAARRREFALRLALGAEPSNLVRLVLRRAIQLAGAGLATGVVLAVALQPLAVGLPVALSADPLAAALIGLLLGFLAAAASAIPVMRAARLDPAAALRHE